MLAQAAGLMQGNQSDELPPYRRFDGNRPSSILMLEVLTPHALGSLIALYEHKVFVQSCLWNINAFDQWGVELGKNLTKQLLDTDHHSLEHFDPSTEFWLDKSLLS
jgi:glucose-6-phosphate isomerase